MAIHSGKVKMLSQSQDLVHGQDDFLSSLGIYTLQQSGGLSRLCHSLSTNLQLFTKPWQLVCESEPFIVIWPSWADFAFSIATQKPSQLSHLWSFWSSFLWTVSTFSLSSWQWQPEAKLSSRHSFKTTHQLERGLLSQGQRLLFRICSHAFFKHFIWFRQGANDYPAQLLCTSASSLLTEHLQTFPKRTQTPPFEETVGQEPFSWGVFLRFTTSRFTEGGWKIGEWRKPKKLRRLLLKRSQWMQQKWC